MSIALRSDVSWLNAPQRLVIPRGVKKDDQLLTHLVHIFDGDFVEVPQILPAYPSAPFVVAHM